MDATSLLAFAAAFFVFAASPGPDNLTIVARTVSHGPLSGIAYGLGTVTGILIFLALAAFGLSIIASEMSMLMIVLRYAGGAYLIWLGIKLWTQASRAVEIPRSNQPADVLRIYATGLALNLGNPKMPLFYLALLPNFVTADFTIDAYGLLAITILLVEILVIGAHIWVAHRASTHLRRPSVVRTANRVTGLFLTVAGMATVASSRTA